MDNEDGSRRYGYDGISYVTYMADAVIADNKLPNRNCESLVKRDPSTLPLWQGCCLETTWLTMAVSQSICYLRYGDARSQHFPTLNGLQGCFKVILDLQRTEMARHWFYYLQGLGTHD